MGTLIEDLQYIDVGLKLYNALRDYEIREWWSRVVSVAPQWSSMLWDGCIGAYIQSACFLIEIVLFTIIFIIFWSFCYFQSTISIHNSNFFEAHLDHFNIEVNWEDYVVANPDIPGGVRVKPRSTLNVCACKTNE